MRRSRRERTGNRNRSLWRIGAVVLVSLSTPLHGQSTVLIEPALPDDYSQSRNISVVERRHPDYEPQGTRIGSFVAFPRLDLGLVASNNVYLTENTRNGDVFGRIAPSLLVQSDWNRHMLSLSAESVFLRYAAQTPLNRDTWDIKPSGRFDVGDFGSVTAEARVSRLQEDPFTSTIGAPLAILSSYRRNLAVIRGEREVGRTRFLASIEGTQLRFSDVRLGDGEVQSQRQRNRSLLIAAGQAEYALSPGAVLFTRFSHTNISYDQKILAGGLLNRSGDSAQIVGGLNLDLPSFIRGTIGIGYTRRTYDGANYKTVGGISGQIRLDYFLSDIMDFNLAAKRVLDDSATTDNNPYVETSVSIGANRSIRDNIILGTSIGLGGQNYINSPLKYGIVQFGTQAKYMMSRRLYIRLNSSYSRRERRDTSPKSIIDEANIALTMELHQ